MEELFLKLLDMSVSASWLILAVIAARLLLRNAPKSVRCILWALVALRLACPASIPSPVSLAPQAPAAVEQILTAREVTLPRQIPTFRNQNGSTSDNAESADVTPKPESPSAPIRLTEIFSAVWLAGVSAMLLYALSGFLRLRRTVSASLPTGGNLWICDDIPAPFILGILRPRVYLPSNLDEAQARYVIAHENAHLRHYDHFWKPLGYALLSVYWFHPLVWVAYILFYRDLELAGDERVVREMGLSERAAYSQALLDCSRERGSVAACPLAFGETGVKTRVKAVLNYRKPAFWIVIVSVTVCAVVAACFLTSPTSIRNYAVQDYIPGQGNVRGHVDAAAFEAISMDFAIGADWHGVAVFKNPRKAFNTFRELYADAIREIQEAHDLPPISENRYADYLTLGWQTGSGETAFVSKFLDIYENSFVVSPSTMSYQTGRTLPDSVTEWVNFTDASERDAVREITLPDFPGVTFRWKPERVSAVTRDEQLLFSGAPVWNVFLADITGDERPELCATVSVDSRRQIEVFNYAEGILWELKNPEQYDYALSLNDGVLTVTQYNGENVTGSGPLTMTRGRLEVWDSDGNCIERGGVVSIGFQYLDNDNAAPVSIDPADYGITPEMLASIDMPDFSALSLEALGAYDLHTDGAGAEGSGDELYQRFMNNPDAVLHYIASLGDVKARGENAATELCREIADADVFWYGRTPEFTEILNEYSALYPDGPIAALLEILETEYGAAVERDPARFLSQGEFVVSDNGNDGAARLVAEMPVLGGKLKQVELRIHHDFRGYDTVHELLMAPTGKEFGIESGYLLYRGNFPPENVVYDSETKTVAFQADGQTFVYDARSWA